ncbi:UvrD-helicase domain-containing protein [Collinsella stercoris]|uniref:DNA 3'-5' helicase n=1 Tax=Collinsella stercoris DSM 13279 TaxID=445975 RepID=B6GE82_9ACTN|nr:UvrD-helicase domain-containing protein [Collinsella stercoris]EEA89424.1 UvrD/REP helicase [Collinsella stercoris DSM 13279]UEA45762.1 UvrD-helicase domain-containing protein [Collinsella stercoris DSM 13279]UWP11715.1 UvrD-helicase domain-containing protein [Collinsella stercoris]
MAAIKLDAKQERIVKTLEGPLFVSAGAGSGKTFTLTQRIMYALRPGSKPQGQWADPQVPEPFLDSIDQVLAITFTEKAAEELKERIRAALIDEGMDAEAAKVDNAWISTIHGMCSRIIRAHALDLGLDPAFGVAEYAEDLKRAAVEHVLRRAIAEDATGAGAYDDLLAVFALENESGSYSARSLMAILFKVLSAASASVGGLGAFCQVRPAPSHVALMEAYREIALAPSYANAEAAQRALDALDAYVGSARDMEALRTCFASCDALSLRGRGMGKDEKAAVAEVRRERTLFFAESYLGMKGDALSQLMDLAADVQAEYEALKAEKSLLDNDDLLTRAYDALKDNPLVRDEFAGKFKMVMVDEFQDTAQQQVELVRLLCSADGRELCTVGDAQQSIYRFRGADVSVFRRKKKEVELSGKGVSCSLDVNFRSHADILAYADKIFEGGEGNPLGRDFLHLDSCGEATRKGARALVDPTTARRQAVLVAGGSSQERAQHKARAIAERFARLRAREGFAPGDMVILMKRLTDADVYARAVRAAGMPCVVAGGTSVFRQAPEVGAITALLAFLANPDDGQKGLMPLLTSPMFCLGATELLALATHIDPQAGIVDSRTLTGQVFLSGEIMEEFGELPLLTRAREVLGRAVRRVGNDRVADIVRDVVNESGWLFRLERSGQAQDRAVAANVLKALDIVERESAGRAFAPRLVARAYESHIAHIKESPAALNGADEDAVRIMTVHASKGLEFPVVAVAECDGISNDGDALQAVEREGRTYWSALPNRFDLAGDADMLTVPELDEDNVTHEVPERAAEAFAYMKRENRLFDYEEAARLLYVAITRAREVAIIAFGVRFATELVPEHPTSLVGEVLSRILPVDQGNDGLPDLGAGRLDFSDSKEGDFQLIALSELNYPAKKGVHRTYSIEEFGPDAGVDANGAAPEDGGLSAGGEGAGPRHVAIVTPAAVDYRLVPAERSSRASYSYSSISRELHAEAEDRDVAVRTPQGEGADVADSGSREPGSSQAAHAGDATDATNLGSVVHDACQWMIETGSDEVPVERVDALCRYWGCTSEQRVRIDAAIERWRGSKVRAEVLRWPCVRAEVPFYSRGMEELGDRFGAYAEGAIDLLCTDPSDSGHALVIDYKTGGHADETPEQLREKHALQARVYVDVLHKQGYGHVTLKFVRVEQPDPADPTQPQVVTYNL